MIDQAFCFFYFHSFYALGALIVSLMVSSHLVCKVIPNIASTSTNGWRNKVVADNLKRICNVFALFLAFLMALRFIIFLGTCFISLISTIGGVLVVLIFLFILFCICGALTRPILFFLFWWL